MPGAITVTGRDSPTSSATDARSGPSSRPRLDQRGQDRSGQPECAAELVGPGAGPGIEELGRRGVGALAGAPAGQQPAEQVGHHQQRLGHLQQRRVRPLQRQKLIDRVERQELQARDLVDPLAGDLLERGGQHPVGPRIAIVDRIAQQGVSAPDQPEVHAPGIDADPVERVSRRGSLADAPS